jgi:hypothetical protein
MEKGKEKERTGRRVRLYLRQQRKKKDRVVRGTSTKANFVFA